MFIPQKSGDVSQEPYYNVVKGYNSVTLVQFSVKRLILKLTRAFRFDSYAVHSCIALSEIGSLSVSECNAFSGSVRKGELQFNPHVYTMVMKLT